MFFQKTLDFYIVSSFLLNVKKQTKINSDSCLHKFTFYFVVTSYFNFSISEVRNEVKQFIEFVQDILYML